MPNKTAGLTSEEMLCFCEKGHVTIPSVFPEKEVGRALLDIEEWSKEVLAAMSPADREWYIDKGAAAEGALRKLDNPVFHRAVFREMAGRSGLLAKVRQILGPELEVIFSQVFMKPPGGGGPKPVHQDNFYFGPDNNENLLTVWIALDEATVENGCLFYGEGTHLGPVHEHTAPEGEPFNLQVPEDVARRFPMAPAPVPSGGVSFHHGNVLHQSSANRSPKPRRAAAFHYVTRGTRLTHPALPYDESVILAV